MLLTVEKPLVMESVEPVPDDADVETPFPAIADGRPIKRIVINKIE